MKIADFLQETIRRSGKGEDFDKESSPLHFDKPCHSKIDYPEIETIHKVNFKSLLEKVLDKSEYLETYSREEFYNRLEEGGIETIAFYAPVHFHGAKNWGIYFNFPALGRFCREMNDKTNNASIETGKKCLRAILNHEYFHFEVELFSSIVEGARTVNLYKPYKYKSISSLEEALANRQAYKTTSNKIFNAALSGIFKRCPNGYSMFDNYDKTQSYQEGISRLKSNILDKLDCISSSTAFFSNNELSKKLLRQVPLYLYSPLRFKNNCVFFSYLANTRPREFVNYLKDKYQAHYDNSGGKHAKITFPNGKIIPLPRHRSLKDYLLKEVSHIVGIPKLDILKDFQNH